MKTQFGRITGLTLASLMLLASPFADAATPLPKPERSLLGVRLMSTFKDVLKKFGQPDEIQIGSPAPPQKADLNARQSATGAAGVAGRPGGFGGVGGSMGGMRGSMMGMPPGMAGMGGSMGGAPQMGGRMGGSMGGGMMGMPPGMASMGGSMGGMGGGSMGRLPGFAGGGLRSGERDPDKDMGSGRALPGFPGQGGGSMGGMMPGASGMGTGMESTDQSTGESTWWYHVKGSKGQNVGLHYSFLFNKEGKVIQIQQYGYTGGGKTIQGVGLGSSLGQVLGRYGMSNEGNRTGEMAQMIYGGNEQVVFQLLRNRVIGVTLAVTK